MERGLRILAMSIIMMTATAAAQAQSNDFGMWYELGAEKKLSQNWSAGVEAELRTRNNTRTLDRMSIGASVEYKIMRGLKISGGYTFLHSNQPEELDMKSDNLTPNKWTPSYWDNRHRFNISLSGNIDLGRWNIALRERWQYTYRPEAKGVKYDIDEEAWTNVKGKGKNVSRTRLQVAYNIAHSKIDPFANVEIFVDKSGIQKMRYQAGVEYKLRKQDIFTLTYRLQTVNSDDDDFDINSHLIGISYKHKF